MSTPFATPLEQLRAEWAWLDLALAREVRRLRAARLLAGDEAFRGLCVSDEQADALLAAYGASPPDEDLTGQIVRLRAANAQRADARLPLPRLARLFGLGAFELDAFVICLAVELDLRYETLFAYAQNDVTRRRPTVDLVLRLLCTRDDEHAARRAAFAWDASLVANQLVTVSGEGEPLLARSLALPDRMVEYALGRDTLDRRLAGCAELITGDPAELPDARLAALADSAVPGLILLHGPHGVGKRAAAGALCARRGLRLVAADLRTIDELQAALPLLVRDAILLGAGLYLGGLEALLSDESRLLILARELAGLRGPVVLGSEEEWRPEGLAGRFSTVELLLPAATVRARLWERALGDREAAPALAAKFALTPGQIEAAARAAADAAALRGAAVPDADDLHRAARQSASHHLGRLAQKLEPRHDWDDIVLPPRALNQLRGVCAAAEQRAVVHGDWGFERRMSLGRGLHVLLAGPSGTGKTMAAGIVGRQLGLDLYRVDLATIVSKYIGETEKNLDRIFDAAVGSNAILFFDEADALFGKRSDVSDAHDRYANIEVAYLLQKLETYDGIVLLATNLSGNIDSAFARRLHETITFPFPDATLRARIWRAVLPGELPLAADVDLEFLARGFELAGGNIRNVALGAAFLAAAERAGAVAMVHFVRATAREYHKLGRLPSRTDFAEYWSLIREAA